MRKPGQQDGPHEVTDKGAREGLGELAQRRLPLEQSGDHKGAVDGARLRTGEQGHEGAKGEPEGAAHHARQPGVGGLQVGTRAANAHHEEGSDADMNPREHAQRHDPERTHRCLVGARGDHARVANGRCGHQGNRPRHRGRQPLPRRYHGRCGLAAR